MKNIDAYLLERLSSISIDERLKLNNDSKIKDYRPQIDIIIEELLKPANKTKFGDYINLLEPGNVIKIDKCYKIISNGIKCITWVIHEHKFKKEHWLDMITLYTDGAHKDKISLYYIRADQNNVKNQDIIDFIKPGQIHTSSEVSSFNISNEQRFVKMLIITLNDIYMQGQRIMKQYQFEKLKEKCKDLIVH
jgi:uncharacterized protein YegL